MMVNKRMKTPDTARKTVEKNMNKTLHIIQDTDKSTTVQNDLSDIFALRDTLVESFDKIKALMKIFSIFLLIKIKVKRS